VFAVISELTVICAYEKGAKVKINRVAAIVNVVFIPAGFFLLNACFTSSYRLKYFIWYIPGSTLKSIFYIDLQMSKRNKPIGLLVDKRKQFS